jgi:hypothetical protein
MAMFSDCMSEVRFAIMFEAGVKIMAIWYRITLFRMVRMRKNRVSR